MTTSAKFLSMIAAMVLIGSSAVHAESFANAYDVTFKSCPEGAIDRAQGRLDRTLAEMKQKQRLRDNAREAWKRAKLSGDIDATESAYQDFMTAKDEVRDALDAYREARKIKYALKKRC